MTEVEAAQQACSHKSKNGGRSYLASESGQGAANPGGEWLIRAEQA